MLLKKVSFMLALIMLARVCVGQVDTVLNRYRQYLFVAVPGTGVRGFVRTLDAVGAWSDIDYSATNRSVWRTLTHLERLQAMAAAWANPRSILYHNDTLDHAINRAFDYWLYHRFYNPNWWYNEIGVPQYVRNIMVLRDTCLSAYQRVRGLEELGQYRINGTGSNLIWSGELGFYYGALSRDTALMRHCIDTIIHEVRITTGEGIQPDYSFHMHGRRLQMYGYGTAFLKENVLLATQCLGTPWAYPPGKVRLLVDFVLKGCQWMARGIGTVPGTLDRGVSRRGALHAADIRSLIPLLINLCPSETPALQALSARQQGHGTPLRGFRYFPYADFATYQQQHFSFFLKTVSTRTLPTESINGENLQGHLLSSGDGYLIRNGKEYFNLMGVWKWDKLPGTTVFAGASGILRKSFVGSVTDQQSGITAMDYVMRGKKAGSLSAHKVWFCHGGLVVCLIAGLTAHHLASPVFTVLDQCRWQGPVTVNGLRRRPGSGGDTLHMVRWITQNNIGYMPLTPATVIVFADTSSGRWSSISVSGSGSLQVDSIFMPILFHGIHPENQAAAYLLTGAASPAKMARLAASPVWKILRNDTLCQAVGFRDTTVGAAFFAPGHLKLPDGTPLAVSRPCLVLLSKGMLYVSDPAHRGGTCTISIHGKTFKMSVPEDGTTLIQAL